MASPQLRRQSRQLEKEIEADEKTHTLLGIAAAEEVADTVPLQEVAVTSIFKTIKSGSESPFG